MSLIDNRKYVNVLSREAESEMPVRGGVSGAVISVNGKTGVVELTAEDVGAMPLLKAIEGELVLNDEKLCGNNTFSGQTFITSVNAPNVKWAYLPDVFLNCKGITEIKGFDKVESGRFANTFKGCVSLTTLDENIFSKMTGGGGLYDSVFSHTFDGCASLKRIPSRMFESIRTLGKYMFEYTFANTGLEEIPSGLFANIVDDDTTGYRNDYAFQYVFRNTKITAIPEGLFDNLVEGGFYEFQQCFQNCLDLTTIPKYLFKNITGYNPNDGSYGDWCFSACFSYCPNLEGELEFSSLVRVGVNYFSSAFSETKLTSISFPALRSDSFAHATSNSFNYMLGRVNGCTVHFPSNVQSVIGSWSSVTSGFGGTNTTVLFDLPATE